MGVWDIVPDAFFYYNNTNDANDYANDANSTNDCWDN